MRRTCDDTHRLRCAHCGYDLFGLPNDVCQECGNAFDPNDQPEPIDPDLARSAAGISVGVALATVCLVIKVSLDEVSTWGYRYFCCRGCSSSGSEVSMIALAHLILGAMLWHAREHRICRRTVANAILAVLTEWISALVILEYA